MQLISFKDWMNQQESSAFTRRRRDALLGLAPEIPDAEIHRHSTFPFEKELRDKKKGKKKKKEEEEKDEELKEAKRKPVLNKQVDDWLKEIEGLRPDLAALDSVIKKRKNKPKKGESETETETETDVKDGNGNKDTEEPEENDARDDADSTESESDSDSDSDSE